MLELDELYDIIVREYPQLKPYTYTCYGEEGGTEDFVCIGIPGEDAYTNVAVLKLTEEDGYDSGDADVDRAVSVDLCGGAHSGLRKDNVPLTMLTDDILNVHADDILRLIRKLTGLLNYSEDWKLLNELGFARYSTDELEYYLRSDNFTLHLTPPYTRFADELSRCDGRLEIGHRAKTFNTLGEVLDYIVDSN